MKKILLALSTIILNLSVFAQSSDVNRLVINQLNGTYEAHKLENVDYINFVNVEGEVKANVDILDVSLDKIVLSVTRTEACQGFKLICVPSIKISNLDDTYLAEFIDGQSVDIYYQDFTSGELTGIELEPNTNYTIATVGIDEYDVLCDVSRADFTAPALPLVGNPFVDTEVIDAQYKEFTIKFTPNSDVSKYSVIAGEKGTLEDQFEMFAPMFGYANIGQMIEGWGVQYTAEESHTWTNQAPSTDYEIYIQAWDSEGTMAPYQVAEVSTLYLGGEGTAEVTIRLGDYKLADWGGEMLPSQYITYIPNDQASSYRIGVYTAEIYDAEVEAIKSELCSEPPMPTVGWFQYEELTADYQINPNTECVAIAAAKNINGEWGPITELRFTTPAETPSNLPASKVIRNRSVKSTVRQPGLLPTIKKEKNVKITIK